MEVEGLNESFVVEKPVSTYSCPQTDSNYQCKWKSNLKRHVKSHAAKNPPAQVNELESKKGSFTCEFCGKQYRKKYSLTLHRNAKHLKKFKYFCGTYKKGFAYYQKIKVRNGKKLKIHLHAQMQIQTVAGLFL